jgi:hypothetical protein
VLLPRAAGLFMVADSLRDQVEYMFDFTIGYSGLDKLDIPYEEYSIPNVFFSAYYPKQIHIHVRKFRLDQIPGMDKDSAESLPLVVSKSGFSPETEIRKNVFGDWLMGRYMEKDLFMKKFYEEGKFEDESLRWKVRPTLQDWTILGIVWLSSCFSIPRMVNLLKVVLLQIYRQFCIRFGL